MIVGGQTEALAQLSSTITDRLLKLDHQIMQFESFHWLNRHCIYKQ